MALDLRKIEWGTPDAKQELRTGDGEEYKKLFVTFDDLATTILPQHLVVWGGRGCGKSAVAWWLKQQIDSDGMVIPIEFEDAEGWVNSALHHVGVLSTVGNFPTIKFVSDAWYHAIVVELMRRLVSQKYIGILRGRDVAVRYLKKHSAAKEDLIQTLAHSLERVPQLLDGMQGLSQDVIGKSLAVTAKGLLALESFLTANAEFTHAESVAFDSVLHADQLEILVVVDSIDKWLGPVWAPEAREEYMALCQTVRGLTKALMRLQEGPLHSKVSVKALLPRDMREYIKDRSTEHELHYHHEMQWKGQDLAQFVARRIARGQNLDDPPTLANTWGVLFPDQIENIATGVRHDPFEYMLRHSHYRPREILMLCRLLTEHAVRVERAQLKPKEFTRLVHEHSVTQAKLLLDENRYAYPQVYEAVHKLDGLPPAIERDELFSRLRGVTLPRSAHDLGDLAQIFYDMGVLGVVTDPRAAEERGLALPYTAFHGERHCFAFRHFARDLTVAAFDTFIVHPMFFGLLASDAKKDDMTICHNEPME